LAYAEAELRWEQGTGGKPLALATVEDFVAWLNGATDWVEARPGERWFYLNEGYILLGGIIEKLSRGFRMQITSGRKSLSLWG
jgi:CubicO group peptidase (beta-lactamase class C family)